MKLQGPMLVVKDIEKSKAFYTNVLGLRVTLDLGANVTFTGGLSVQTEESWHKFIKKDKSIIKYNGHDVEIYFEEDNFDEYIDRISKMGIEFLNKCDVMEWGQKVTRFYDPDMHIIEVGENLAFTCKRLNQEGMTADEIQIKTGLPMSHIVKALNKK